MLIDFLSKLASDLELGFRNFVCTDLILKLSTFFINIYILSCIIVLQESKNVYIYYILTRVFKYFTTNVVVEIIF